MSYSATTSPTLAVKANPQRVALILSGNSTAAVGYSPQSQPAAIGGGIVLPISSQPVLLDVETFGDLVSGNLYVQAGAAVTVTWIEVYDTGNYAEQSLGNPTSQAPVQPAALGGR